MKYAAALLAALALPGCARWSDHSHGSWLDQVGRQTARGTMVISDEHASSLTGEVVQLRAESETLRIQLAAETDRVRRIDFLRDLRDKGDRLRRVEQRLRNADRMLPPSAAGPMPVRLVKAS